MKSKKIHLAYRAPSAQKRATLQSYLQERQSRQWPEKKIVDAIVRERKLEPNQATALQRSFDAIQTFRQHFDGLGHRAGQYRQFKKNLERLEKQLGQIRSEIARSAPQIDHFFGDDLSRVLRPVVASGVPLHLDGWAVGYFLELLEALHRGVSRHLKVTDTGGRPRTWPRDLFLEILARDAPLIIGKRATITINGPFEKLCESVFVGLGMCTSGLSEAIGEKLTEMKRRPIRTRPRGRVK